MKVRNIKDQDMKARSTEDQDMKAQSIRITNEWRGRIKWEKHHRKR